MHIKRRRVDILRLLRSLPNKLSNYFVDFFSFIFFSSVTFLFSLRVFLTWISYGGLGSSSYGSISIFLGRTTPSKTLLMGLLRYRPLVSNVDFFSR